jgi:hypothetical protein
MLALIVLFGLLAGLLTHADNLTTAENQRGLFGVGSLAGVFSALTGVLLVTGEYASAQSGRRSCSPPDGHA